MFWPFDFWVWGSGVEVIPPPPIELSAELEVVAVVDATSAFKEVPTSHWFVPVITESLMQPIVPEHIFREHST